MEYIDLYDENKEIIKVKVDRKSSRDNSEYALIVRAIIIDLDYNILIAKRSENEDYPSKWECTAGAVQSGENNIEAVIREIKEEIALDISENFKYQLIDTEIVNGENNFILETFVVFGDFSINDVQIDKNAVSDYKLVNVSDITELIKNDEFVIFSNPEILTEAIEIAKRLM